MIDTTGIRPMQNTLGRAAPTLVPNDKAGSRVEAGWDEHCRPCSEPHPISPHPCELIATRATVQVASISMLWALDHLQGRGARRLSGSRYVVGSMHERLSLIIRCAGLSDYMHRPPKARCMQCYLFLYRTSSSYCFAFLQPFLCAGE